jgi:PKD repeat protein
MKRGILYPLFICLLIFAACGNDNNDNGTGGNAPPTITGMTPNQVSRGQLGVDGQINGTNLAGATSVNLGDGITVESLSAVSSVQINIKFSVNVGAAAGPRTVTVTTSNGTATAASALNVTNNHAPVPKINISPNKGAKNTNFIFDASDSTDANIPMTVRSYHWDFGDSKSDNGRVVEHKYNEAGTFTVVLTVTDNSGASNEATATLQVENGLAPTARYSVNPTAGDEGTPFVFNASASSDPDGTIKVYDWNFEDGTKAKGQIVTHKFIKSGVFGVTLTVTDNDGLESAIEKDIDVKAFDEQAAKDEIRELLERFFRRFANLEHYSAEAIVEGWSDSPGCRGREHEIEIIHNQQETIRSTDNEITKPIDVFIHDKHVSANATVIAHFEYTFKNGTSGSGTVEHFFTLIFEDGEWRVCNFTLGAANATLQKLFPGN